MPCVLVTTILLLETNEEEKREGKTEVVDERGRTARQNREKVSGGKELCGRIRDR